MLFYFPAVGSEALLAAAEAEWKAWFVVVAEKEEMDNDDDK